MDRTEQKKAPDTPVVSPLAKDKTYGERVYHGIVDWGLNYWTNLLASAGFSHWAENGTNPIKIWGMKKAESPRQIQENLATWIAEKDPFMNGKIPFTQIDNPLPFMQGFRNKIQAEMPAAEAAIAIAERSMARARSLTLLMPGFAIMIPAVWLGAKIKPWFVEKLDRRHYGDDAMDDPTLKARHHAIAIETRPTFLGTFIARLGTALAVQVAAQSVGSKNNFVNKIGKDHNIESFKEFGINEATESFGAGIGGALPEKFRERGNGFLRRHGFDWSKEQMAKNMHLDPTTGKAIAYNYGAQDLGRFIATDTVYTLVSALTINPFLKLLRLVPFMSYTPKVASDIATPEAQRIKVPANHYADAAPEIISNAPTHSPQTRVSHVREHVPAAIHNKPNEELATAR